MSSQPERCRPAAVSSGSPSWTSTSSVSSGPRGTSSSVTVVVWPCVDSEIQVKTRRRGRFRIVMKGPDCDHEHTGEYLVVERPRRLVFTWISESTHGRTTTVTLELVPRGPDETELVLVHEGLPDETAAGRHRSGWEDILRKLEAIGHEGGV